MFPTISSCFAEKLTFEVTQWGPYFFVWFDTDDHMCWTYIRAAEFFFVIGIRP